VLQLSYQDRVVADLTRSKDKLHLIPTSVGGTATPEGIPVCYCSTRQPAKVSKQQRCATRRESSLKEDVYIEVERVAVCHRLRDLAFILHCRHIRTRGSPMDVGLLHCRSNVPSKQNWDARQNIRMLQLRKNIPAQRIILENTIACLNAALNLNSNVPQTTCILYCNIQSCGRPLRPACLTNVQTPYTSATCCIFTQPKHRKTHPSWLQFHLGWGLGASHGNTHPHESCVRMYTSRFSISYAES
jgi:hypothetical protein